MAMTMAVTMTMTSCDKWDCNGNLDGMWQLTEWRDVDNNVKATKEDMIFYSFQLQMASFRKNSSEFYLRASLEVSPEQIRIYDPFDYVGNGHDKIKPMSMLSAVGVPEDGIFLIQVLTGNAMELKTNAGETLVFRKY
jgi:hypothetical protein